MTTGIVTEIQRFSLHDGPGIRSTVFLKGCNMRCAWCHNPETFSGASQLHVYADKCIGCEQPGFRMCGHCTEVCPTGAQRMEDGAHIYDASLCNTCGKCADVCFSGALALSGREMTPEQVMAEILQDKEYYDHSGGGVTFSGGEALCQPEFLRELLALCKRDDISAAVETNLNYPWELLEPFLPDLDMVMFDVKLMDEKEHIRLAGVSNQTILANAGRLLRSGKPVVARTPVVPGATDSAENIEKIAAFLRGFPNLQCYELLNYNPLGESKYESLGMEYPFQNARPLHKDAMERLADAARTQGVPVKSR